MILKHCTIHMTEALNIRQKMACFSLEDLKFKRKGQNLRTLAVQGPCVSNWTMEMV